MSGVGITGLIEPLNGGSFPVFEDINGLGGMRVVSDNTQRNAIPANFKKEGMLVYSKLTKAIYGLKADLATWVLVTTLGLGTQAAWSIDTTTGNDSNSGLPGSPLATAEEFSARISPGGARLILQQVTTATFGTGSYGQVDVTIDWFKGAAAFTHEFIIAGNVSSTANILLSAVVAQAPATRVRGELTTLAGTFVAGQRIRVTSGTRAGSLSYSTGLHSGASNTYVGPWLRYVDGSTTAPSVGDNVVVDTLNTTIAQVSVNVYGAGNAHVKDFICTNSIELNDNNGAAGGSTTGGSGFVDGCQLASAYLFSNAGAYLWSCRITTFGRIRSGNWKIDGSAVQGILYVFPYSSCALDDLGNVFDGGTFVLGGTSTSNQLGPASCRVSGAVEFCNGIAASAIRVSTGSQFQAATTIWSGSAAGAAYTTGIQVDAGALYTTAVGFGTSLSITCTNAFNIAGELIPLFSQGPIYNWQMQCGAIASGVIGPVQNAQLNLQTQVANIGATNLFPAFPAGGMYLLLMSLSCLNFDAAEIGAPLVTVSWSDDSGVTQTETLTIPLTVRGSARKVQAMQINHAGNTNATYTVTGIVTIGAANYNLEIECRRMVFSQT